MTEEENEVFGRMPILFKNGEIRLEHYREWGNIRKGLIKKEWILRDEEMTDPILKSYQLIIDGHP
jgi:hypothetical protein